MASSVARENGWRECASPPNLFGSEIRMSEVGKLPQSEQSREALCFRSSHDDRAFSAAAASSALACHQVAVERLHAANLLVLRDLHALGEAAVSFLLRHFFYS